MDNLLKLLLVGGVALLAYEIYQSSNQTAPSLQLQAADTSGTSTATSTSSTTSNPPSQWRHHPFGRHRHG